MARGGWLLLLALVTAGARGEDLLDVYHLAQREDPRLKAAQFSYGAARENPVQARADLLPTVSVEGSFSETRQDISQTDNRVYIGGSSSFSTHSYEVAVRQPIVNWSALERRLQAMSEAQQASLRLEDVAQELMFRVGEAYFAELDAESALLLVRTEKTAVGKQLNQAQAKYEKGLVGRPDVADARARLLLAQAEEIKAQHAVFDASQALTEMAGIQIGTLVPLAPDAPTPAPNPARVEDWLSIAYRNNRSLQAQKAAVEVARREVERRRGSHYPTLDLVSRFEDRDTGGASFGGSGARVQTADVLLNLSVPIFAGGKVASAVRQAEQLHYAAIAEQQELSRKIERQVRATFSGVLSSIERVRALEGAVQGQVLATEAKRAGYPLGLASSVDVLNAERDLTRVTSEYLRGRHEYFVGILRLQMVAGALNESDLVRVNARLVVPDSAGATRQ